MRVRRERFADEALGDLWAIGVGGVNECDAELDSAAQYAACFGFVGGLAPCAFADQTHGAIAEPMDGQIAADEECAA